jgi:hypothetical protein
MRVAITKKYSRRWNGGKKLTVWMGLSLMLLTNALGQARTEEYFLLTFCDSEAGHDSEFAAWSPTFVRSVAALPGVTSAEEFRRAPVRLRAGAQPLPEHLAVFVVAASQADGLATEIGKRVNASPAVDKSTLRNLSFDKVGSWKSPHPESRGEMFLQVVLMDAAPGQDAEFQHWFLQSHGPQLASVPGVYEEDFASRSGTLLSSTNSSSPAYLSAMRFQTDSIPAFKDELEQAARSSITPTTTYDMAHAWRETYQRVGNPIP